MAKCAIEQGRQSPGMHGHRRSKTSDYGMQLREKQRLRRMYGLQESQFRLFFERASRKSGKTGEILLQMLEMRLDNICYRLGFSSSRKSARQFVNHGHVLINGRKSTIASRVLKAGDVIEVVNRPASREYVKPFMDAAESRGVAPWVLLDKANAKGEILHVPSREEIQPLVNEQLIVELYSK